MANTRNEFWNKKSVSNWLLFQKLKGNAPSSATAPVPTDTIEHHGKNSRARPAYSQGSVAQGGSKPLA